MKQSNNIHYKDRKQIIKIKSTHNKIQIKQANNIHYKDPKQIIYNISFLSY